MSNFENNEATLASYLRDQLLRLPNVTGVSFFEPNNPDLGWDFEITVRRGEWACTLAVVAKRNVFPRDLFRPIFRLTASIHLERNRKLVPVFIAGALSTGAREVLRQHEIGYADLGGTLRLKLEFRDKDSNLMLEHEVDRERPPPKEGERRIGSPFAGRRSQVVVALLHNPNTWLKVMDLSKQAQVSPGVVSQTLQVLERENLIEVRGQGPLKERRLTQPAKLLDLWAEAPRLHPYEVSRWYCWTTNFDALLQSLSAKLDEAKIDYAVTREAAANLLVQHLSSVNQVHIAVPQSEPIHVVAEWLGLKSAQEGDNVVLLQAKSQTPFLYSEMKDGIRLANLPQLYVDLRHAPGRAKELAAELRQRQMGY